jgi:hypothetical protein
MISPLLVLSTSGSVHRQRSRRRSGRGLGRIREPPWGIEPQTYALRARSRLHSSEPDLSLERGNKARRRSSALTISWVVGRSCGLSADSASADPLSRTFEAREPLIDGLLISVDTFYAEVPRLLKAGSAPAAKKRRPTQPLAQGTRRPRPGPMVVRTSGTWSSASSLTNGSSSPAPCVVGNRRRVRWLRLGRRRR